MTIQQVTIPFGQDSISAVITSPDEGSDRAIVLIHGGPGGTKDGPSDLFIKLASSLSLKRIASVRFDMLGAGQSTGEYVEMTLANQAEQVRAVHEYTAQRFRYTGALGESLGAASLLLALPLPLASCALLWPAVDLPKTSLSACLTDDSQKLLQTQGYLLEDDIRVGKSFVDEFQRLGDIAGRVKLLDVPTLLVHGDSDSEVPHVQSETAFDLLSVAAENKRLVIVPQGDHCLRLPNEQALVVREVTTWFDQHTAS